MHHLSFRGRITVLSKAFHPSKNNILGETQNTVMFNMKNPHTYTHTIY